MRTSPKAIAAAVVITASALAAGHGKADAAGVEHDCIYTYVVTDGHANNVATYVNPRGSARGPSIHPGDAFFVAFGGKTPDQIGRRHRMFTFSGFRGWITFPRDYLVPHTGPCIVNPD